MQKILKNDNIQQSAYYGILHPQKMVMAIGIAGLVMMFAALTSAYLVRRASGNWLEFPMPSIFIVSTVVLVVSSLTIQLSYRFFTKGNETGYKGLLVLTALLGVAFIVLQYKGWMYLVGMNVTLQTNPSSSFLFVISGLHAAHVIAGLGALLMALIHAYILPFKATEKRKHRFSLTLIFWHFLDLLWLYLFLFLLYQ